MTKYLTTASVTIHGVQDPLVFEDTITYHGGSTVASLARAGKDIKVKTSTGAEVIIPWHAVILVEISHTTGTAEDPEDAFCAEEDG